METIKGLGSIILLVIVVGALIIIADFLYTYSDVIIISLFVIAEILCIAALIVHEEIGVFIDKYFKEQRQKKRLQQQALILEQQALIHERKRQEALLAAGVVNNEKPGWVYILTNPDLPGCVKIGMTTQKPEVRARGVTREYQARGKVVQPFSVYKAIETPTPRSLEKAMHGVFGACNVGQENMGGGRELFFVSPDKAENRLLWLLKHAA